MLNYTIELSISVRYRNMIYVKNKMIRVVFITGYKNTNKIFLTQ